MREGWKSRIFSIRLYLSNGNAELGLKQKAKWREILFSKYDIKDTQNMTTTSNL